MLVFVSSGSGISYLLCCHVGIRILRVGYCSSSFVSFFVHDKLILNNLSSRKITNKTANLDEYIYTVCMLPIIKNAQFQHKIQHIYILIGSALMYLESRED